MSSQMYDLRRDRGAGSVHVNQWSRQSRVVHSRAACQIEMQIQSADLLVRLEHQGMASTMQQVAAVTAAHQDILAMSISEPSGVDV